MRQVARRTDEPNPAPLTEPVFLILLSLVQTPMHGYALLKEIEHLSQGRVRLSTGTLYGALRRLLNDGWIERFELEDTSREKQAYRLTSLGRRQVEMELDRIRQLARTAAARLRMSET